ncbi:MAG TPA: hypothetical protein RMF84_14005, partial [Polyangiaceae bacterium LLY-WYZ-14_1]|nr:hypothetical protein [Polyangiaceae bacterium LLY-WYZ-14_1]
PETTRRRRQGTRAPASPGRGLPGRVAAAVAAVALAACASSAEPPGDRPDDAGTEDGGPRLGIRDAGDSGPGGGDRDAFVDPGCPDAGGGPADAGLFTRECDPFALEDDCDPGLACYVVQTAAGGVCEPPRFASRCIPEGPGDGGDGCRGFTDCGAGLHCFNTGRGNQCLFLCDLAGGEPACPRGRLCRPTDLPGFGACF